MLESYPISVRGFCTREEPDLKKFEYRCVWILALGNTTTRVLNSYGAEGWELVSAWGPWFYFKRPVD